MDSPRDQASRRSSPLQARALHFFRKLALRARASGGKSRDAISPVTLPPQNFQRAHSSVDLLRKPDISRLIGFRVEDYPHPVDADDSSQAASASSNSPRLRPRRHSTSDSLRIAPVHASTAVHGVASSFFRDQGTSGNKHTIHDASNSPTPALSFMRSSAPPDTAVQPFRSPATTVSAESKPDSQVVQHAPNDGAPRLLGDVLSYHATLATPLTDLTPSTSSSPVIHSGDQLVPAPSSVQERPLLFIRHTAPLPPPFRVATERGLRLSPSVITRQPMPLLNLPPLPPPPPITDTSSRQVPLRNMPSLSRHGRSNAECRTGGVDVALEDSDEEDGDDGDEEEEPADAVSVHQSDDDDEPSSAGLSDTQNFDSSQNQPTRDDISLAESPDSYIAPRSDVVVPNIAECSCPETHMKPIPIPLASSPTTRPFSSSLADIDQRHALNPELPKPGVRLEPKPSLYHAGSRSMINLGSTRRTELGLRRLKSRETVRSHRGSVSGHTAESAAESEESETEEVIRRLRRTSMPSYQPTSNPPPYPTFSPRPKGCRVIPQEEEERERLPSYSNSLYLIAIMPRKMEFSSPGVQAKDRKWRRVVCELEGTTLRVYKCPPGASGAGVLGDWWEKRVGVGDVASPSSSRTRRKEEQFERPPKLGVEEPSTSPVPPTRHSRRRSESQSSMETQSTMMTTPRHARRTSGASFLSPFRGSSAARPEMSAGESSHRAESHEMELLPVGRQSSHSLLHESVERAALASRRSSQPPQPRSSVRLTFNLPIATGRAQWRHGVIPKPPQSDLIRAYTLQHAESGLGNDYQKRKNVIRVRLEGEQFLLQAPNVPAVVEWIEGLHAGTNIALDIDQRLMPRGPMFPRRRRRRTRRVAGEGVSSQRPSAPRIPA